MQGYTNPHGPFFQITGVTNASKHRIIFVYYLPSNEKKQESLPQRAWNDSHMPVWTRSKLFSNWWYKVRYGEGKVSVQKAHFTYVFKQKKIKKIKQTKKCF